MNAIFLDYQCGKYAMLEPPVRVNHYRKALERFQKSAAAGEARGAFMLGKVLFLWGEKEEDRAVGISWLEKASAMGYIIADRFLEFTRAFGRPITREILEAVTLDCNDADLLCLAGQLKFFDTPFSAFPKDEHPVTMAGIELLKKAAALGHVEATRFLFEAYFGYFWQIYHNSDLAGYWLEKYLALTDDPVERAELDSFADACQRMWKSRLQLFYGSRVRSCSQGLPENRGSLDSSFYDRFRT